MDASITLESDDKHMEFTQIIGKLIFNAKKVDEHFVINSYKEGGKNLSEKTDNPTNMTELGGDIQVSGNSRSFEMRRPWKKDKKGVSDEDELKHPKYISASPCPAISNRKIYSIGSVLSGGK